MNNQNKIIAIVGPTGSGKTAWTKILSNKFNLKPISVDSRQIYKGMDIGTGKDNSFHQELIDVINPDEKFSVAEYQKKATKLINKFHSNDKTPIIVGGTGLYLESILYGYILPELKKESEKTRDKLEKLSDNELIEKIKILDPLSAKKIDLKNRRRVIRALEVTILTKKPFSAQQKKKKPKFDSLIIGIKTDRQSLYAKVDARIDKMINDGLVEEVRKLTNQYGFYKESFNTIGYKEIIDYLNKKNTLKEATLKIKNNTHAYIRRQETWFSRDRNIIWLKSVSDAEKKIKKFLL